jgi:hypothetical protein
MPYLTASAASLPALHLHHAIRSTDGVTRSASVRWTGNASLCLPSSFNRRLASITCCIVLPSGQHQHTVSFSAVLLLHELRATRRSRRLLRLGARDAAWRRDPWRAGPISTATTSASAPGLCAFRPPPVDGASVPTRPSGAHTDARASVRAPGGHRRRLSPGKRLGQIRGARRERLQ